MYSSRHESFGSKAGSSCFSECASGLGNPTGASTTEVVLRTYEANSGGTMVSPIATSSSALMKASDATTLRK